MKKSNLNHTYHNKIFEKIRKRVYLAENAEPYYDNPTFCLTYHNDAGVAWNFSPTSTTFTSVNLVLTHVACKAAYTLANIVFANMFGKFIFP